MRRVQAVTVSQPMTTNHSCRACRSQLPMVPVYTPVGPAPLKAGGREVRVMNVKLSAFNSVQDVTDFHFQYISYEYNVTIC